VIAVETSSMIDWLKGLDTPQTRLIERAMDEGRLVLPPPVEAELLSFPKPQPRLAWVLERLPRMEVSDGIWARAGLARRQLKVQGLKAMLADALIAQCCIDADAELIATDTDFRHFAAHCGLKLAT
jgi:predicted nucleic acid-binding protein